jgi:phosphatidylglycerophosphatase A
MPGTCGSLAALAPCFLLLEAGACWPWILGTGILLASLGSVLLARGLPASRSDPGWFVLDEAAGLWLALLATEPPPAWALAAGFGLFRLFDILKPPPLRRLEQAGAGFGILLDDLGAGMYALVLLRVLVTFSA